MFPLSFTLNMIMSLPVRVRKAMTSLLLLTRPCWFLADTVTLNSVSGDSRSIVASRAYPFTMSRLTIATSVAMTLTLIGLKVASNDVTDVGWWSAYDQRKLTLDDVTRINFRPDGAGGLSVDYY